MVTFKLILGVVLVALYLLALAAVILLGLELAPRRLRGPTPSNTDEDRNHPGREKHVAPTPVIDNDWGEEGARPSSLIPYYHHKPDRAYLLQLKYAVEKANEEAVRLYGPLPSGGLPVQKKTKPNVPYRDFRGNLVPDAPPINEENEMKLRQVAAAAALAAAGTQVGCEANHSATTATHVAEAPKAASNPTSASSASGASEPLQVEISSAKTDDLHAQSELQPFVEPGMQIRAVAKGDINNDGLSDVVIVLGSVADREKSRSVLLLVRNESGTLRKAAQNDKMVPCADCGGMLGDPFADLSVDDGFITIVNEGGSGLYWSDEYVFKYAKGGWILDKLTRKIVDRSNSKSKTVSLSEKDFGVMPFEAVDPEKMPIVERP